MTANKFSLKIFKEKLFSPITSVPPVLDRHYYPSIDGLRGVAILTVIFYHSSVGSRWNNWTDGTIGVLIFFVISGFLITTLLLKEKVREGKVSLKKFYIRRVLRIFPVAYLYIFTLIILHHWFNFKLSVVNIVTSLLYLKNFPTDSSWLTGHFWTLSVEEQFYLFMPILLVTNVNRYIKFLVVVFLLVPVIDYIGFNNLGITYTNKALHSCIFIFLALLDKGTLYILFGSLLSILVFKKIIVPKRFKNRYYLSLVLFLAAFLVHFVYLVPGIPYVTAIMFTLLIGSALLLNLYENNFLTSVLGSPVLVKIGKLSYSLYIWQQLFTLNQPWSGKFKYSDSVWLNLAALFIVAFCSYNFFELKFLKLKKHFEVV